MAQATWEEVKRLAADLQRAQLSETIQRLSDRNCIEIVNKLVSLRLLDIVHTVDGKEYLTEHEIAKEIREELAVRGGRVNLVDLQTAINIDYSHVETKVNEIVRGDRSMSLVLGQLIDRTYVDRVAEDINDYVQEFGQVSTATLTKQYDLPASFLLDDVIMEHLGGKIQGTVDGDILFTDKFVDYHRSVIRGAFSALTRPKTIFSVMQEYNLQERLFHRVIDDLIKRGELVGSTSGGKGDKALYTPDIYTQAQNRWVQAFFHQNGYVEFDAVSRLGIGDPKAFVKKLLKSESIVYLKKCCVGKSIQDQVSALVDEALGTSGWVDVQQYLPTCIGSDDAAQIISSTIVSRPGAVLCCQTVVASKNFLKACQDAFTATMETRASKAIRDNPNILTSENSADSKFAEAKDDRRDQRKKKQAGTSKSGGGTQGREVKMKSTKNKYRLGHVNDADDETPCEKESSDSITFMSVDDMEDSLLKMHPNCPAEMISDIVSTMHRPLTKQYHDVVKRLYLQSTGVDSGAGRKKIHNSLQEKIDTLWSSVQMFVKGLDNFPEDVCALLNRHLLNTLCTEITNVIFKAAALDNMINADYDALSPEVRLKLLSSMTDDATRKKLTKLHQSLTKTVNEFTDILEDVCSPENMGILLRKVDKKKERQIVHGHRMALLQQMENELDPALCLHLCVVVLYQTISGCMLHAPGRCVPHIITYLSTHLDEAQRLLLTDFQNDVIKSMKGGDGEKRTSLHERVGELKQLAVTFKKNGVAK